MAIEIDTLAKNLTSFAEGLGKLLGQNCEIALFNVEDSKHKLVYLVNSQVTDRKYDEDMNQHELEALDRAEAQSGYSIFSYTDKDGRRLKTAIFILKDKDSENTSIMIISFDITDFLLAKKTLEFLCLIDGKAENDINANNDNDYKNVGFLMEKIISDVLESYGKPVSYLSKEDKVKIVSMLKDKGVFLIKGSVEYIADKLCVSRYTIYNYLEEIRLE